MIKEEKNSLSDPEIRDAMNAMQRAAQLARETAIQTDTAIIIVKDGKQVRVTAEELRKEPSGLK
jgi:hypothetical protein